MSVNQIICDKAYFIRNNCLSHYFLQISSFKSIFFEGLYYVYHLIIEIFFALNVSFTSGTTSAFIFDTLQNLGQEKQYKKIWGNALFYGLITKFDFRYTFYAAIIPIFGWIADIYDIAQALTIMGVTTLISGIVILIILKKDKVI